MLAEKPDFSPAPDEEFQLCYETRLIPWVRIEESVCQTVKSNTNGIVPVIIPATQRNISQIYLQVTSVNYPEVANMVSLESWFAMSFVSMEMKSLFEPVCKGPLNIEVYVSNDTRSEQSMYYQLIGANSLQAPVNVKLQMQPWTPPISGANIDQEETDPLPQIKRSVLSIELPASMPPYSMANRLVLYFLDTSGRIVSDSMTFFIDCLNEANVKMNMQSSKNREIEVKIDGESKDSSCVVDISSNEKRKEITKRRIMHLLDSFDVVKQLDKCQQSKIALATGRGAPYTHNTPTSTNLPQNPFPTPVLDFHNSWDSFNDIGLIVASNKALDDSPCESDVFPRGFPPNVLHEFQHHSRIMGLRFTKTGMNAAALHRLEREVIDDMLHTSLLDSSEKKFSGNTENNRKIYGNAICLSKNNGMRFVDNKLDTSSAPVDFVISAPPKSTFGEEIPINLHVGVAGKGCAAIQATVENSNLFAVSAIPAPQCVCNSNVLKVTLKPKAIGRLTFQMNVKPGPSTLCSSGQPVTFTAISSKDAVLVSPPGIQHKEYNTTLYCSQNKQSFSLKKSPSIKKATISSDILSLIHLNLKDHHSHPSVVDLLASIALSSYVANTPHLKATESLKHLINKETAKSYQDILSYRLRDGSFTISRRKQVHSYLSLTVEAFKTLTQLRKSNIKVVQDGDLGRTLDWIYRHQERDGCFYQQLTVVNVWPVTLDSTLQTTAFVAASLMESGFNATSSDPRYPITTAYQCIKSQLLLGKYSDLSLALLAYVESLRNDNAEANKRITELLSHATDSGEEMFWNSENNKEIAGYAILTLLKLKENAKAKKIAHWLVRQPKPLQSSVSSAALIEVWTLFTEGSNLKVKVNNRDAIALNGGESQNILAPTGNTDVQLEGTGCALLLLDTVEKFSDEKKTFFNMTVSGLNTGFSTCRKRLMRLCIKETGNQNFNASVIKVNYATGFTVDDRELLPRLAIRQVVSDFKIQQNYLLLYLRPFYNAPEPECFDIPFIQTHIVQNSRPAYIESYDYYEYRSSLNHFSDVVKYSFPKECNVTKEMSHTKRLHSAEHGGVSRRIGDENKDLTEARVFRCPEGVKDSCPDCRSANHHYKNEICKSTLSAVIDRSRRMTHHGHWMTYGHPSHRRSETKKCVAVPLEIKKLVHLKQEGRPLVYHSEILHFFMLEECKSYIRCKIAKGEGLVVVNNLEKEFTGNVNLLQLTEKDFLVNLQLGETKFPKCV
ncbi:alpha-2-macroglobiln splicing variant 1 precursor-like protein [Leptotrombidium deliense]|uniref:Alpha-2-macroglobiln splicing variant 1-like protein n=1 Tax=Leptotrombidium deliense TaxID=299467 RepID=A0A443SAE6_9ACAR|nr:alpha-2-macroglobiln splicing variant 1 precursor-like protein [Leptotrombidium deliense]